MILVVLFCKINHYVQYILTTKHSFDYKPDLN